MFNVILPTYNESGCIVTTINMLDRVFKELNRPYLLVIVDDNSPDGTSDIVKALGSDSIKVVDRPGKMGLGSAYMDGLEHCVYPYTVIMDSDLQHDPFAIIDMYKMAGKGFDIVSGSRYSGGGSVSHRSFVRGLVSCTANNLARYTLGLNATDLTGSFRLYKTDVLRSLMGKTRCRRFGFQMEILARAEAAGCSIAECPIVFYTRKTGESKISSAEVLFFLAAVAQLYFTM